MAKNLKNKAKELKRNIPAVYIALKSKETPIYIKVLCLIIIIYALSPIDLIPDFIPVVGYLDDLIILPALIILVIKLMPKKLWQKYLKESETIASQKLSKNWYYAIPFILIWIALIYWFLHIFKII